MLADGLHDVPAGKIAMVVTYLETRTPQMRGAPCPEGLTFEPLPRRADVYKDVYRRVGQDWMWGDRLRMDDAVLLEILLNRDIGLWSLTQGGTPEALLELDFRQPDRCILAYFGVTAPLIGTGAGAFLMDRAQEMAFAARDLLTVQTCTLDSPQALGFYQRSGFTGTHRAVEVVDDPRLTGVLPWDVMPDLPMIDA
ncbi:MAG: GNAT family N-acetyltransferase [Pseudomonadota bacterium]